MMTDLLLFKFKNSGFEMANWYDNVDYFSFKDFSDMGSYWRSSYELANFEDVVKNLWDQMKPLYMQLHAYVRKKLIEIYGPTIVPRNGLIPAHLLGIIDMFHSNM